MPMSLEEFARRCRAALLADGGPGGREAVCRLVQEALGDEEFVTAQLPDGAPERTILYEDPELGFAIVGHVYQTPKTSPPHDHGTTWAIYGQASGETMMTDWIAVTRPAEGRPGQARRGRDYALRPGDAYLYHPGDVHSPRRSGPTRLLRIEGVNTDRIERFPYEVVA
jgi:predicted metal-dependent enzyme (double-stranded beta helix superfamily)